MTDPIFQSDFLQTLQARGYIHQITHPAELDAAARAGIVAGYIGFDATAPSLHVGSLIQIMMLRRLQQAGGRPVVIMGGGTTKVGDPTGKDASRPQLTDATIQSNIASIKTVFEKFLTFGDGPTDAILIDNDAWLSKYGYVEFLRDYGTHFTVNRMLAFDSVKLRLEREQPMTFLEFNYMLMQSVDFLELNRRQNVTLQMGGSDQWGNIVSGVDLVRRVDQKAAFGLTTPLLTTASGGKMGKTALGAIWLNAEQLSAYDYWQFWRNAEDGDVGRFMRLFTDLSLDEIARFEALEGAAINDAKKALADAATTMLHGAEAAASARAAAEGAFEQGVTSADLPVVDLPKDEWEQARSTRALVKAAGFARSLGEAGRHMAGNAIRINDELVVEDRMHSYDELLPGHGAFKVQFGKKKIVLVRPV
ncbi:tyrosine--tRNA ligase [Brevundimonas sp. TWP2-3-4b1]|uniref:tyrosine--tRNA ligase n=1 Tax=Brevundimonas sp. TWP2-3-4b1 TaxID=2804580 RepID=UPI003CEFE739